MGDGFHRRYYYAPDQQLRSNKSGQGQGQGQTSNYHKGVQFKARSNKYAARLCLPGGRNRKLELGEYNSYDAAVRAYRTAAFYYNKLPLAVDSISEQGQTLVDSLPCIPRNLSDADKLIWVREQARQYAERASTLDQQQAVAAEASERPLLHTGASTLQEAVTVVGAPHGLSNSASTLPTTSESAGHQYSFPSYDELESGALKLDPFEDSQVWNVDASPSDALERLKRLKTRSSRVELQVGRTTTSDQVPAASELRMTDTILAAQCELRKQGWGWIMMLQSLSSVEAGVLFSLPRTQQAAPALVMTGSIISAFQELFEQGWEVRLEPSKCDNL